MLLFLFLSGFE